MSQELMYHNIESRKSQCSPSRTEGSARQSLYPSGTAASLITRQELPASLLHFIPPRVWVGGAS